MQKSMNISGKLMDDIRFQYNLQLSGRGKDRTRNVRVAVAAANSLEEDDDGSSDEDEGGRAKLRKDKCQEEVLRYMSPSSFLTDWVFEPVLYHSVAQS